MTRPAFRLWDGSRCGIPRTLCVWPSHVSSPTAFRPGTMHGVIIAGGFGTRARALTGDRIPKALLPVAGVPIIFRQMRVLHREGIKFLTVLGGHLGNELRRPLVEEAARLGLRFELIVEEQPLGTAGCLTNIAPPGGHTLVVYGDMLFD